MTESAGLPVADHTAPRSIRRWLRAHRANGWVQLVGVLVIVELFLLLLFNTGFEVLSAARAYVGGESLYSKGQKDAVGHLRDLAASHAEQDYQLYLTAIAIPLGDRQARLELEKPQPDAASMYSGLVRGGNHEADLGRMVWLFRTFRQLPLFARAVDVWTRGDADIQLLNAAAVRLHDEINSANPDAIGLSLSQIAAINSNLTELEIEFSNTLGEASRWVQGVLLLADLNHLGMHIAIDDFGTGYSSLSYLKRLPVDELKIDRSFVQEMVGDDGDRVIVRSTIDLAHNLGLRVVAEGVEDQATLSLLATLGCDEIQSYFVSRPLTADGLTTWLENAVAAELRLAA